MTVRIIDIGFASVRCTVVASHGGDDWYIGNVYDWSRFKIRIGYI